jgi:hypothetical protein
LLRWIHLRHLVPITELIQSMDKGGPAPAVRSAVAAPPRQTVASATVRAVEARRETPPRPAPPSPTPTPAAAPKPQAAAPVQPVAPEALKDTFLSEVQKAKKFFYGTVVLQAEKVEFEGDRVVFTFGPKDRALRQQLEQTRTWLEDLASRLSGRKMTIAAVEGVAPGSTRAGQPADPQAERQAELKQQALSDSGVQAMLDVFAAEIKEVEER